MTVTCQSALSLRVLDRNQLANLAEHVTKSELWWTLPPGTETISITATKENHTYAYLCIKNIVEINTELGTESGTIPSARVDYLNKAQRYVLYCDEKKTLEA